VIATLPSSLLAAIPLAVAAGLVSFASPCVLPLVPGYLAFLGGAIGVETAQSRYRAVVGSFSFILGFAAIFVSEGALFGELGQQFRVHQRTIAVIFGVVTILLGLFFAGWLPAASLQRERRWHHLPSATVAGACALGFLFGVGWAPCIGPTLASILGIAASSSGATAARGSVLAFFYCLGLGIPFVIFAVAGEWAANTSRWLRAHQRLVGRVGGLLLVAIGLAEVSGQWAHFVTWLQVHSPSVNLPI
jgi:cytochrome c-type biogenesis protein